MKARSGLVKILILPHYLGWILNLEANREMHKVKIQVVQLEIIQGLIQAQRDVLWGKMGTPQLFKKKKQNRKATKKD